MKLTLQRQQEPGRPQLSPHPPAAHVWLVNFYPLTVNGQRREAIARVTASGHESDEGDRVTARGHSDLPDEQGIANVPTKTGSGQKTATGHTERNPDGISRDPKTKTDQAEKPSVSELDRTESGPKTATDPAATAHGKTVIETSPAHDALDREREEERKRERRDRPRELPDRERRRGRPTGSSTRCIPRPSLLTRPSEGREEEEEGAAGCVTSEEVLAIGEVFGTGGREEPEG